MSTTTEPTRVHLDVDGCPISYLTAGTGPCLVLLHGTYWSRVWLPVLQRTAAAGLHVVAVDFPGLGRSGGELGPRSASVPELATWVLRFVDALAPDQLAGVVGHDIGGAVAQHLAVATDLAIPRWGLVNSVTYDSWPVPGVAKYRDRSVVEATTVAEILAARRRAVTAALGGGVPEAVVTDYLAPWQDPRVARSWMALAAAADSRYTLDLVEALRRDERPKLLVWGADDAFQPLSFATRFASEIPGCELVPIADAGHIPMENSPGEVADALARFFGRGGGATSEEEVPVHG